MQQLEGQAIEVLIHESFRQAHVGKRSDYATATDSALLTPCQITKPKGC